MPQPAGAVSRSGGVPSPGARQISAHNHAYEPHTVHVLVERDGRPVYWADHEATAGDEIGSGGSIVPCAWDDEAGTYVVRARLDARTKWQSIDLTDYDSAVLGLILQIGDANTDRHDTPNRTIWRTSNPSERCETTATTAETSTE